MCTENKRLISPFPIPVPIRRARLVCPPKRRWVRYRLGQARGFSVERFISRVGRWGMIIGRPFCRSDCPPFVHQRSEVRITKWEVRTSFFPPLLIEHPLTTDLSSSSTFTAWSYVLHALDEVNRVEGSQGGGTIQHHRNPHVFGEEQPNDPSSKVFREGGGYSSARIGEEGGSSAVQLGLVGSLD